VLLSDQVRAAKSSDYVIHLSNTELQSFGSVKCKIAALRDFPLNIYQFFCSITGG